MDSTRSQGFFRVVGHVRPLAVKPRSTQPAGSGDIPELAQPFSLSPAPLPHLPRLANRLGTGRSTSSITLRFTPATSTRACVFTPLSWRPSAFLSGAKTPNRNELSALRGSTSSTRSRRRQGCTCASSQPLASRSMPSTALASRPDFAPTVRRATEHMAPATTRRSFSIRTTTTSRRSTATSVIRDTCRRGSVPRG